MSEPQLIPALVKREQLKELVNKDCLFTLKQLISNEIANATIFPHTISHPFVVRYLVERYQYDIEDWLIISGDGRG